MWRDVLYECVFRQNVSLLLGHDSPERVVGHDTLCKLCSCTENPLNNFATTFPNSRWKLSSIHTKVAPHDGRFVWEKYFEYSENRPTSKPSSLLISKNCFKFPWAFASFSKLSFGLLLQTPRVQCVSGAHTYMLHTDLLHQKLSYRPLYQSPETAVMCLTDVLGQLFVSQFP